jgi:archaemetzincin
MPVLTASRFPFAESIFVMTKTILFSLIVICFLSCKNRFAPKPHQELTIIIQPLGNISKDAVQYVFNEIQRVYPKIKVNDHISMPANAFNKERNRYRADSLISILNNTVSGSQVIIGLTDHDISTTKNEIKDWGIMGLAYSPGRSCVASTFRLSKTERLMQLFKVSIHELGHTQGLPHCEVKSCFMRDAEGRNPTNEEKEFCPRCKARMIAKGWQLS